MSGRVWIVPVGEQAGAIAGPLVTMFRPGDAIQFLASERTRGICKRITDVLARRGCVPTLAPVPMLLSPDAVAPDVVLRKCETLLGRQPHLLVLANGGTKQWLFPILGALRNVGYSYEVVFSQGASATKAVALPSGKWRLEYERVKQLSREELLGLLELSWCPSSGVLSNATGGELRLKRLEAHHNQLYAQVNATSHGSVAQDLRRAAMGRHALALLGLEPRRVLVTGFKDVLDGHPRQLRLLGIAVATEEEAPNEASRFFARARMGETCAREGGDPSNVAHGTELTNVVGVLPIGSKSGGVIKQIAALAARGVTSLLIVADGADEQVHEHVTLLGELLGRWGAVAGPEASSSLPFRVLWVQRDARTGMDTWERADATIPVVCPEQIQAVLRAELREVREVIVHLKPVDKYLSWVIWQGLQQLTMERRDFVVGSTFELSSVDAPLIEQMKLQSSVSDIVSTPLRGVHDLAALRVDELDEWLWQKARDVFVSSKVRKLEAATGSIRQESKYAEWLARNGLGTVAKGKDGDLLEHILQVRLRMAMPLESSAIYFDVKTAKAPVGDQMDVVTAVTAQNGGTFVVWEAKCSDYKPRPVWRTALTKAHRYTSCAPDRTHAVVVVPRIPSSSSGYVEDWGIAHIDFRVLENKAALLALATTGSVNDCTAKLE